MAFNRFAVACPAGPLGPASRALPALSAAFASKGWGFRVGEGGAIPKADMVVVLELGPEEGERFEIASRTGCQPVHDGAALFRQSAGQDASLSPQAPLPEGVGGAGVRVRGDTGRGLMYGVFELAGQIESSPPGVEPPQAVRPVAAGPETRVRSLCLFAQNREVEEEWFHSPEHWEAYFETLARARFNMFSLVFAHQTAYMAPPYPFMVDVPGYGHLRTPGWSTDERQRNLETLRMVSRAAAEWGLDFVLGVWQQHAHRYGQSEVEGLSYEDLFDYCPRALAKLLDECPDIRGVQFRMNSECGIEEDDQERFFSALLRAVAERGRPLWVDLRAKGLREGTISAARSLGLDPVVSTKFWTEHMGLPHFATRTNPADAQNYRRYGYWDLLRKDRPYRMLYRLWSMGTQKILPWGDVGYASRFARSCKFGDAVGFEVCAPLSNKGYGNRRGGAWRVFAEPSLEYTRWEFQRYWAFFMAFGLGGYRPGPEQPVLDAEFVRRFGHAVAPYLRRAYEAAGGILPLITASHGASASVFGYWPEIYSGGSVDTYARTTPGDVGRFRSAWEWAEDELAGRPDARQGPPDTARMLAAMAGEVEEALAKALRAAKSPTRSTGVPPVAASGESTLVGDSKDGMGGVPENRMGGTPVPQGENVGSGDMGGTPMLRKELLTLRRDLGIQCHLARYHADRMMSAAAWELFRRTGDRHALLDALRFAEDALRRWEAVVALTDGVYYDRMVFRSPERQVAHWKHEAPFLRHDVDRMKDADILFLKAAADPASPPAPKGPAWYEQERKWREEEDGSVVHWAGGFVPAEEPAYPQYGLPKQSVYQDPAAAVAEALARAKARQTPQAWPGMPHDPKGGALPDAAERRGLHAGHVPVRRALGGAPVFVRATRFGGMDGLRVRWRLASGEGEYHALDMAESDGRLCSATIPPGSPGDAIEYYLETDGGAPVCGSLAAPLRIELTGLGARPLVEHEPVAEWPAGRDMPIRATVEADGAPACVRLHWRRQVQSEDWNVADMRRVGGSEYEAAIPGEAITEGWNLLYAIEAVDRAGAGVFCPDMRLGRPCFVVEIVSSDVE